MRNNIKLVQQITDTVDVLFLQETWLKSSGDFNGLIDRKIAKKTYHKTGKKKNNKGRPSAGIGWVVSSLIKHSVEFKSNYYSVLKLRNLAIIGVYTRFNQQNQESRDTYETDLVQVISTYKELRLKF